MKIRAGVWVSEGLRAHRCWERSLRLKKDGPFGRDSIRGWIDLCWSSSCVESVSKWSLSWKVASVANAVLEIVILQKNFSNFKERRKGDIVQNAFFQEDFSIRRFENFWPFQFRKFCFSFWYFWCYREIKNFIISSSIVINNLPIVVKLWFIQDVENENDVDGTKSSNHVQMMMMTFEKFVICRLFRLPN